MAGVVKSALMKRFAGVLLALVVSNSLSVFLFLARSIDTNNNRYWFLLWNLLLGWLPLIFVWWLSERLQRSPWLTTGNLALTVLWLGFLPNSFYLLSDLIHLQTTGEINLLYDVVMFSSFIFNGYVMGYVSLFLMHLEFLKRLKRQQTHLLVGLILFLCSFAIYLGRNLRWNTWDLLAHPAGVLFDVSDRIINPVAHPQAFVTTTTFFLLLGAMYIVIWQIIHAVRNIGR